MKIKTAVGPSGFLIAILCFLLITLSTYAETDSVDFPEFEFTDDFSLENCTLTPSGINPYFPLVAEYRTLEGEVDGEWKKVFMVTDRETEVVNGHLCRVVREYEYIEDELVEIAWKYYAFCQEDRSVFAFGEYVIEYEDGIVVGHDGSWRAGRNGAKHGLAMAGRPLLGSRYYAAMSPGVAMDRVENLSLSATVITPAGVFTGCLMVEETTPLDPDDPDVKYYAPYVGLVQDGELKLTSYKSFGQ